jgi:alpha-glucosidase
MAWEADAPNLGFSSARPWLRTGADHAALAVDRQERDPDSLLNLTRRLVALRRAEPALRLGAMEGVMADGDLLLFERCHGNRRLRAAFNFGTEPCACPVEGQVLVAVNGAEPGHLPAFGGILVEG